MSEIKKLQKLAGINEIKINKPGYFNKFTLDKFKSIIRDGYIEIIEGLAFEDPEMMLRHLDEMVMGENNKYKFCLKLQQHLEREGFGEDQFQTIICNVMIS